MNIFQKKLEDIVRGARLSDIDLVSYNSQVLADLKEELKSRDLDVKTNALIKLFYFYHEGNSLEWAAFHILECMSSQSAHAKKIGHMVASLALPSSSDAMIMSTNLLKKGIKSNVVSEISIILSCMGNICTIELGREVMDPVLNHCHNSKSVIRKKAFATLRTIYESNPNIIPHTIEKVIGRLADEKEPSVVSTILSIMFTALEYQPRVHPLFIKPLYALFEKKKNNWNLIKIIKLFDLLIDLEPRLKKKLYEPFLKLSSTNGAKSVEIELIKTVFKHFKEFNDLYKSACYKLKSFIDSTDPNLKTLGLQSLKRLLLNDKEVFEDYYEFLLETYQKGDQFIKLTIADIFTEYINKRNTEQAVNIMVQSLDQLTENSSSTEALDTLIQNILHICSKNYYSNVEDCEWLLMGVLLPVLSKVKKINTAAMALDILTDFTLRVDEIKELAVHFGVSLLSNLAKGGMSLYPSSQSTFVCKNEGIEENQISIPTKVLETLVFIFGEYSPKIQEAKDFSEIIKTLLEIDPAILRDINAPLEICLAKMTISLCALLKNDAKEPDTEEVKQIETFLTDMFKLVRNTLTLELEKNAFCQNEYMALLLHSLELKGDILDQDTFTISPNAIKACKELNGIVFHPMKPIQASAQELVVVPNELQELQIELTLEEKAMIDAFEKEMSKPVMKLVTTVTPKINDTNGKLGLSAPKRDYTIENMNTTNGYKVLSETNKEKIEGEEPLEKAKPSIVKAKREFRVMTDEERPQELRTN